MELLPLAFLAGVLTILAPCILSLLPVILGGSADSSSKWRPIIIVASLSLSVIIFTLLLKGLTLFIDIPPAFWRYFSGSIITFFGITLLFPNAWTWISIKLKLYKSDALIEKSNRHQGNLGAILLGASLGPVFTTCSPTYTTIVATVLPQSIGIATVNLIAYSIGLSIPLLLIAYGGRTIANKLRGASNPNGWFKKTLGALLILTGILIATGLDKKIEILILDQGFDGVTDLEQNLLQKYDF